MVLLDTFAGRLIGSIFRYLSLTSLAEVRDFFLQR